MSGMLIKQRHKKSVEDRVVMGCIYIILILIGVVTIYPLIFVVSASFSNPDAVASGKMILWPVGLNLKGYKYLFANKEIWIGYLNTLFYTVGGTSLNLLATLSVAYAISRRDLVGRNVLMTLFLITMYFGGGLIPSYLNVKSMGLVDTRFYMLIGGLVSTYNLIVCRTYFSNSIPWELHEAGFIDGASNFKIFSTVVLPLSKPIVAVMALYYGEAHWNQYFQAMVYLNDRKKFPLQMFLREILVEAQGIQSMIATGFDGLDPEMVQALIREAKVANQLKFSVIVASTLPVMIIYPFFEKYFAKGVMIGSVKG